MKKIILLSALCLWAGMAMAQTDAQNVAANESLTTGGSYRIYTQNNGTEQVETKYYLTASGTLTATENDAAVLTLNSVSPSSGQFKQLGWQMFIDATHAFSNPSGSATAPQAGTSLNIRAQEGSNKIRDTWEAQVLFLDAETGLYAVRSTNQSGNNWGANCYWTVAASGTELPNACYDINAGTPHFIWQLELAEDERVALQSALETAQANYAEGSSVYYYLQQAIDAYDASIMREALNTYASLQDIQLGTPYILHFINTGNGRTIVFQGADNTTDRSSQQWISGAQNQLWTLVGESFGSFRLRCGNGLYYHNTNLMVEDEASAQTFSLELNTGYNNTPAWEIHRNGGTGNNYAINGASGVKVGNSIAQWSHNDAGNAFRFLLAESRYMLTTSTEEAPIYYYLGFAETGYAITGVADGEQALSRAFTGSEAQQWALIGGNVSSFRLKNRATGLYLTNAQKMTVDAESAESYILNISASDKNSYELLLASKTSDGLNPTSGVFSTKLAHWTAGDVNNRLVLIPATETLYSLDNAAAIDGKRRDLQLQRTFAAGWTTLCVPFNLTAAQVTALFGEDAELYEYTAEAEDALTFTRVSLSQYDNSAVAKRDYAVVVTAGKPYLLHIAAAVENPTVLQALLSAAEPASVEQGSVAFRGNYETLSSAGLYGITAAGSVKEGKAGKSFAPWTAYFQTTGADVKLQVMIDGVATGISELDDSTISQFHDSTISQNGQIVNGEIVKFFDLSGRRVEQPTRGIYVVNGKKVIMK